ncbi:MAG: helix-turn-helix domain-containing protein [Lachnospiraceae bacterium]|nr:helix-turn-helix domain-containing protein [Lachnospiraceae bacterium]MCQ2088272.1 helix-turn-helix domain-containing protein [Bacilli bacterium]
MRSDYMMTANDVAQALGISKGHAYKIVRELNDELEAKGFIVVAGKIPRAFWDKKFYNVNSELKMA